MSATTGMPSRRGRLGPALKRRQRPFRSVAPPGQPGKFSIRARPNLSGFTLPRALGPGPYRRYWLAQLAVLSAGWIQNTAGSLVILDLTTSAFTIGVLNVVAALPLLLFSLHAGVVADRYDRRRIMMATQTLLGVISLAYAALLLTDQLALSHVFVLAAIAGTVVSFDLPATQAFVTELVDRDDMPEVMALNSASFNATRTIAPLVAGVVVGLVSTGGAYLIYVVALIAPLAVLHSLRHLQRAAPAPTVRESGTASLKAGVGYIRANRDLSGLVLTSATISYLVVPGLLVLLPLYVMDHLGGGTAWVAATISMMGAGAFAGAMHILRGNRVSIAQGNRLRIGVGGMAGGLVWLALAPSPWVAVPGILISGYAFTLSTTQIATRLQQLAPNEMRGRIMSVNGLAFNGMVPISTLSLSALGEVIGLPAMMLGCGVALLGACTYLWSRFLRAAFQPEPAPLA